MCRSYIDKQAQMRTLAVPTDNIKAGILLVIGFTALIPFVEGAVKALGQGGMVAPEITFGRFLTQVLLIGAAILLINRGRFGQLPAPLWPFVLRGLLITAGSGLLYAGLTFLPLADSSAILFVMPLMITALSALLLRETVGPWRWSAALAGFAGAMLVASPNIHMVGWAAMLPALAALCYAGAVMLTRRFAAHGSAIVFQFTTALTACIVLSVILLAGAAVDMAAIRPHWPTTAEFRLLLIVGLFATVTNMMMTQAARIAPSSVLAPFLYLEIIGAMLMGYFAFSHVPGWEMLLGGSIVVVAGLIVWWRETSLAASIEADRSD